MGSSCDKGIYMYVYLAIYKNACMYSMCVCVEIFNSVYTLLSYYSSIYTRKRYKCGFYEYLCSSDQPAWI